ncbi:kinetochore Sim4 complex subunit Fta4 [Plectosphaerella plurivora]|uniref:Kinetochore Sim4 complex subunit Fta4 n=1 Tax=Plectosphaerella plurivora TaxID=936078 RepID=A0A9P8VGF4_9PEZI|nr:kinetochore Sim4 complex subunit Fta4 [Plectosphaerella plurivora]
MANQPPTILFLKQSFVETQVRLLSRPLDLGPSWQTHNAASDEPLTQPAVDEALHRANRGLAEHTRRVYPPQSTRIVAEQINKLYKPGAALHEDDDDEANDGDAPPKRGVDLTDATTISSLPPVWPIEADTTDHPMESSRYAELTASLAILSTQRAETLKRVQRLRRIKAALRPFTPEDSDQGAASTVQENLATRDGQVEKELEKMRMLLVRVGGRVSKLPNPAGDDDQIMVDSPAMIQKNKVQNLLDLY